MKRFVVLLAILAIQALAAWGGKLQPANLSLYVYQRTMTTGKPASISIDTYNLPRVSFVVYRVPLTAIVPNPAVLEAGDNKRNPQSVTARLNALHLSAPVTQWTVPVKTRYANAWTSQAVKLPKLSSGVYVIEARGGGVRKRTWIAVSTQTLLVKRSPDAVLVWLVNTTTGQPATGVPLAVYSKTGRAASLRTGGNGLGMSALTYAGSLWVVSMGNEPAFAYVSAIGKPSPYTVYTYTDRPVYRPGQLVQFRGTIRAVQRGQYRLPEVKTVRVQIKTAGDTLVYDQEMPINAWGSFSGEFALAAEPPLGTYSLEVVLPDQRAYTQFQVEAYRKPEFDVTATIAEPHYLGGATIPVSIAAQYYFGSPVSGGKVNYRVSFDQVSSSVPNAIITAAGLGSAASGRIEENYSGEATLDKDGKLTLNIPTRNLSFDREIYVNATVTDLSHREREASAETLITAARYRFSLRTDKETYQPGATVKALLTAQDYDDKPVANATATVTLIEHMTDREGRDYLKKTEQRVTTDKDGQATTSFTVERPGYFELEAWGQDADEHPVYSETSFCVSTEKTRALVNWPRLETYFDKTSYAPGDTAKLRVKTSLLGSRVLLTVEGERLYYSDIRRIQAKEFLLNVPVKPEYAPGVYVQLQIIRNGEVICTEQFLNVPAADKQLTVILTPSKTQYQPGEQARYEVTVRDPQGRGVAAEIGLGVIDASLYAIREDDTQNPFDFFWQPQTHRIDTVYSLSSTYPGGGYQVYNSPTPSVTFQAAALPPPAPAAYDAAYAQVADDGQPRVRKDFADVAFWAPSVTTGQDGLGSVEFPLPDNLTSWRATARAVDRATDAGQGQQTTTVTLPLLVRLSLPRFYVQHDEATAAAIVHNYTAQERPVQVTMSAEGGKLLTDATQTVTIPAKGIKRLTWKLSLTGDEAASGAQQQVRILVSADGGEGAKDAMESLVPLMPDAVKRVEGVAGITAESATVPVTLSDKALPGSAHLSLSLSPSLAGPIFESLDYLSQYPDGCTEQTMDSFLPAIIAARTLKSLGAQRPEPKYLQRYIAFGLQKLLRYQHQDGGWHWWEFDQSDPYITAYVVYGLAMARDAGYPLAAGPLPRGVNYLTRRLDRGTYASRTYLLWALASADVWPGNTQEQAMDNARRIFAHRGDLDTFSRASLALALQTLSGLKQQKASSPQEAMANLPINLAGMAGTMADELAKDAVVSGTTTHWTANATGDGCWLDSDVEVTSQVLRALLAIRPSNPQIVPAVRWLMAARHGKGWNSTKDTASAVLALTDYLRVTHELAPQETIAVKLGDQTIKTVTFTQENLFGDPVQVVIPSALLQPGVNTMTLEKAGVGNLYWSATLDYLLPPDADQPLISGIQVKRIYHVSTEDPVTAGAQPTNSSIEVTTTITADQNYRYLVVEEPVPAGCEIVVNDDFNPYEYSSYRGYYNCDRREIWDDRIVFYFDDLSKGEHTLTYRLRTESPGEFHIRPNTVSMFYFPEVRGEGKFTRLRVVDDQREE